MALTQPSSKSLPPYYKNPVREYLGVVGSCRLWIMGLAEITKPLYASTRGPQPVGCTETKQRTFEVLKKSLTLGELAVCMPANQ